MRDFKFLLQIHDDLMFELLKKDAELFARWAKGVMESVMRLDVPIIVEAKDTWGYDGTVVLNTAECLRLILDESKEGKK